MLNIPKTIIWIAAMSLLLLALMTSYRLLTHSILHVQPDPLSLGEAAWLGFRFDCRYVACFAMVLLLVSFLPGRHPFRHQAGKVLSITIATVFFIILMVLYAADFLMQLAFEIRLSSQSIAMAIEHEDKVRSTPWVILVLLAGLGGWLLYILAKAMHKVLEKKKSGGPTVLRIFWQALSMIFMVLAIYGSFSGTALAVSKTKAGKGKEGAAFIVNPFESLLRPTSK